MANTTASDAAAMSNAIQDTGTAWGSNIDSAANAISQLSDGLGANITADQAVSRLQVQQVRKFIKFVGAAWNRYVDVQRAKFDRMKDSDKLSMEYMKRSAGNGFTTGDARLASVGASVSTLEDNMAGNKTDFDTFQSHFDSDSNTANASLNSFLNATFTGQASIQQLISDASENATTDEANIKAEVALKLTEFENSLNDVGDKVLQSLDIPASP